MKKTALLLLLIYAHTLLIAQNNTSIQWIKAKDFETVMNEAKKLNKIIFIDYYATWCQPCKKMDQQVFADPDVANFINERFISVKVQMDKTNQDDSLVKSWYPEADRMGSDYNISSVPTYLFFSPGGDLIGKFAGYQDSEKFLSIAHDVYDPQKNPFVLFERFRNGILPMKNYRQLAMQLRAVAQPEKANEVARAYKTDFLLKLPKDSLLKKENIGFLAEFADAIDLNDGVFKLLYNSPARIDSLLGRPGSSKSLTDFLITTKGINPQISKIVENNDRADFKEVTERFSRQFKKTNIEKLVYEAAFVHFYLKKDWQKTAHWYIEKTQKFGLDTSDAYKTAILNQTVWDVFFLNIENPQMLEVAAGWIRTTLYPLDIDKIISPNVIPRIDTYANLLHKLGKTKLAIEWQEKAIELNNHPKWKKPPFDPKMFEDVLVKMRNGQETWH